MRSSLLAFCALFVAVPAYADEAAKPFFFQPNDRIVFLGDSITEQYQYSSTIELFLTTRMPTGNFVFINAGISGDTAHGGASRFQTQVLDEKPTAITINFGMNDGGYGKFDANRNKLYTESTTKMLEMAKNNGVRVALISPNAVDARYGGGGKQYLETQKQFYAPLKDIAGKFGLPFADQYAITRATLEKMEAADPMGQKVKPFPDAVHTNSQGGLLMAHAILTSLNAPPMVSVAAIEVNGTTLMQKSMNCKISDLTKTDMGIKFTRLDEALPMPIQNDWQPLLPYVNDLNELNHYSLMINGLNAGDYEVLIDGVKVAQFASNELAKGVNLGNVTKGPIFEQGTKVWQMINAKNGVVHDRFSNVVRFNAPSWLADVVATRKPAELAKRMEQINTLQAQINEAVKPKPHTFEIKAITKN